MVVALFHAHKLIRSVTFQYFKSKNSAVIILHWNMSLRRIVLFKNLLTCPLSSPPKAIAWLLLFELVWLWNTLLWVGFIILQVQLHMWSNLFLFLEMESRWLLLKLGLLVNVWFSSFLICARLKYSWSCYLHYWACGMALMLAACWLFIVRSRVGGVEDLAMDYGLVFWLLQDSLLFQCRLLYGKRILS